MNIEEL